MNLKKSGADTRTELHQLAEWDTAASTSKGMVGKLKLFEPTSDTPEQYTFMQIHDNDEEDDGPNKPLLRLFHHKEHSQDGTTYTDYIWAAVRLSQDTSVDDEWRPIMARPDAFFTVDISVKSNEMVVKIDGTEKVSQTVGYWAGLKSYYKAGAYLQDDGVAQVQFETLEYYYE